MKTAGIACCFGMLSLFVLSQTQELGKNVYYNDEGKINIAVDASVAILDLEKPYVPFVLFMGTDPETRAVVHRGGVSLLYKENEHTMAGIQEFRKNYRGESRDLKLYAQFGKSNVITPKMQHLRLQSLYDFFPQRAESSRLVDEMEISSLVGFATWAYFTNPGFEAGDTVVIKVVDKNDPDVWGSVSFELGGER